MANNVGNIANVKHGPVLLYFDDGTGERLIGLTKGDVTISVDPKYQDSQFHQTGETVVQKRLLSMAGKVKFTVAEQTVENIAMAMPFAVVYTDGTKKTIGVGIRTGFSLLDSAGKLRIHPINELGMNGDDDPDYLLDDVTVWKAANATGFERTYATSEDRVFDVDIDMFPDLDKPAAYNLYVEGDPAVAGISMTAPSVSTVEAEVSDTFTEVPVAGLSGVDADTAVRVTFSKSVLEHMVESDTLVSLIDDTTRAPVSATLEYDDTNKRVTLTPASALTSTATYQIVVAGIRDASGNTLAAPVLRTITIA